MKQKHQDDLSGEFYSWIHVEELRFVGEIFCYVFIFKKKEKLEFMNPEV